MAHHEESHSHVTVLPPDKEKIKKLWTVAGILGIITALEFAVAFLVPHEYANVRVWIFITMTIVKAAYIVGEFMHLRHEAKVLIWSILIPLIFIVWMLVAFIYEGTSISDARF
ncbi:cytochrome C oxidase subunit IV family protein [Chryseosolibacter indicus]|uniref:Cytochrome C oxidase subunit IV family protein n=1 Tax=Chryseosolibacter indicus TaxID=2782351 RepID=A0ABS5VUY6_9BACT|nr:cytochrome C oxidase subunit IV family protein [Chryseosolibacter indicus]MBT1705242.1 cytochrome C oxidase subunit IV family protein [Chryseosolibacter indicus]